MAPIPNHLKDFFDLEAEESSAEESLSGDSDSNDLEYADFLEINSDEEEIDESSAEESLPGDSDSNDLEYADLLGTSSEEEEGYGDGYDLDDSFLTESSGYESSSSEEELPRKRKREDSHESNIRKFMKK